MKYIHKPTVVEAMRFDGTREGFKKIMKWLGEAKISLVRVGSSDEYMMEAQTKRGGFNQILKDELVVRGVVDGDIYGSSDECFLKSYDPYFESKDIDFAEDPEETKPKKRKSK